MILPAKPAHLSANSSNRKHQRMIVYSKLGFLCSIERAPFMAILNAYFDESGKQSDHPVITVCGVCASQAALERFDEAWNALLRRYGWSSFHLTEILSDFKKQGIACAEQIESLRPFADCINEHLELGLLQAWDVKGFDCLSEETKKKLGSTTDPYYTAFARGVWELVDYIHDDDRISLVCDDDEATAWDCYQHYRMIRRAEDVVRRKTVSLTFANDEYFPALQAADMVAGLARHEARRLFYGLRYDLQPLFEYLTKERGPDKMQWKAMFADEERLSRIAESLNK